MGDKWVVGDVDRYGWKLIRIVGNNDPDELDPADGKYLLECQEDCSHEFYSGTKGERIQTWQIATLPVRLGVADE